MRNNDNLPQFKKQLKTFYFLHTLYNVTSFTTIITFELTYYFIDIMMYIYIYIHINMYVYIYIYIHIHIYIYDIIYT